MTTSSQVRDPTQLARWEGALKSLFNSKNDFQFVHLISMSRRNLLVLADNTESEQRVVFKVAPVSGCLSSEVVCLNRLSHPNIISLKDWWSDQEYVYLQLEHVPGRCVIDMVVEEGRLSEQLTQVMIKQVVSALIYLHSKGIVHRDVKPDNLVYNSQTGHTKLLDFELSTPFKKGNKLTQRSGTVHYLSPEVRRQCYEGPESDAWSLGVTLYVMLSGQFPFTNDELWAHTDQFKVLFIPFCSGPANHLISQLMKQETAKRMTVEQAMEHNWIKGNSEKKEFVLSKGTEQSQLQQQQLRQNRMVNFVEKLKNLKV